MALTVTEVDVLRQYLCGVMDRADHHAGNVKEIALALAGAILWRKDESKPIKVMAQSGETKNVLWVHINGQRYVFSYNHEAGEIELRKENTQGPTLHRFTNSTPLSAVMTIFKAL